MRRIPVFITLTAITAVAAFVLVLTRFDDIFGAFTNR
jgi:hypothetical protein